MSKRSRIADLLNRSEAGGEQSVAGWVRSTRASGDVAFIVLNDGSNLSGVQLVLERATVTNFEDYTRLGTGTALQATGELVPSPAAGQQFELRVTDLTIVGNAYPDYPLQKKRHSFEYLRSIAHLRPRTNTFGAVFRLRSRLAQAIHQFFAERKFLYVHTPIITASDCEGAGELFRVTT
ncbi:MAG: asparagine--tRNA ligase, partial [Deltaproteobacteria bacterium]|nr:asparagine--tRNA ligase [Deltaproteobacteria bacterium]